MTSFSARLELGYIGLIARLTSIALHDFLAFSQLSDQIYLKLIFFQTYMCFSEENNFQLNKNSYVLHFRREKISNIHFLQEILDDFNFGQKLFENITIEIFKCPKF